METDGRTDGEDEGDDAAEDPAEHPPAPAVGAAPAAAAPHQRRQGDIAGAPREGARRIHLSPPPPASFLDLLSITNKQTNRDLDEFQRSRGAR